MTIERPVPGFGGDEVTMLRSYARHAGHADLIRQSIDGATDV